MTLYSYLKQFKNIAWYPSAGKDTLSMICLSFDSLRQCGVSKEDAPDCFIFTDYSTYSEPNERFALDLPRYENQAEFNYMNPRCKATVFNVKELDKLRIPFHQDMVTGEMDYQYYGRVFVGDILVEHPEYGKTVTKLVYVVAENTAFAFDFLLKKNIKVKYAIHSRYGHGFGGGWSTGAFMFQILKDLGVKYFASDMDWHYDGDAADRFLSVEQKNQIPVLRKICNFAAIYNWYGYNATILYEVIDFVQKGEHEPNCFESSRYKLDNNC